MNKFKCLCNGHGLSIHFNEKATSGRPVRYKTFPLQYIALRMITWYFLPSPPEHRSCKDIGTRWWNILCWKNSEAAFKSKSGFNRDMELMDTVIGHSMVKAHTAQQQDHHRVLRLDGGGMKVKFVACLLLFAYYWILKLEIKLGVHIV